METFISSIEAARFLGVTRQALLNRVAAGRVPRPIFSPSGKEYMWSLDDVRRAALVLGLKFDETPIPISGV